MNCMLTKSQFAFQCNLDTIFRDRSTAYFWTFTFADMPEIQDAAQRWRHLVNWLSRFFKDTVWGVRVYELHELHGVHIHALFNRYVRVEPVRYAAERFGFGRIHVKQVNRAGADYLAKYLTKQGRTPWLKHKRLWTTFGHFQNTRVKDIEVNSPFNRAIKFCQAELKRSKLPFAFVQVLKTWDTDNPVKLKLACAMLKAGHYYPDIARVLRE
jgi:hypothetical protein